MNNMSKLLTIIILCAIYFNSPAQGIFKRLPKPTLTNVIISDENEYLSSLPVILPLKSAWRLVPIAGYMYPQQQIVTGMGYGYQRLHWIDSIQRYYTNWSLSGAVLLGGDTRKLSNPNGIMSIGLSLGVLNQLLMLGVYYNLPTETKGSIGIVFNTSIPLN